MRYPQSEHEKQSDFRKKTNFVISNSQIINLRLSISQLIFSKFQDFQNFKNINPKISKSLVHIYSNVFKTLDQQIYKDSHSFRKGVHNFLVFFEVSWYNEIHKYRAPGVRKSRNHGNVRFGSFQ